MHGVTYPPGVTWCWPSVRAGCIQQHDITELQLSKVWNAVLAFHFKRNSMTVTYVGHNCIGHDYVSHSVVHHNYTPCNYVGHNYIGNHYVHHSVIHHNYTPHNYIGHAYTGNTYLGHNYVGHPPPLPWSQQQALQQFGPFVA